MNARTYAVGGGALDAPCGAAYIVSLRPGDRQKSAVYRRGVEGAAPYISFVRLPLGNLSAFLTDA